MMPAVQTAEIFARKAGALIRSSAGEKCSPRREAPRDTWSGPERRRETRYETCDPVQVYLLDLAGLQLPGVVRDISKSGLRLEIGLPVVAGARLKIRLRSHVIFGEVRYCRESGDVWQAGVAMDDVYFSPQAASRAAEPDASRQESHALARFIVDDHLYAPASDSIESHHIESHHHRMPPVSNDGVQ
jgi:PilZ domain